MKTVSHRLALMLFILALNFAASAQSENSQAPIKWQNYSVSPFDVTFLLPKLPIALDGSERCRGEGRLTYGSYADGVVYVVRIIKKIETPEFCTEKKSFDRQNFYDRVEELRKGLNLSENPVKHDINSNELKLTGENQIYRLVNDYENKRWFELQVVGANENKPEVKNFLESLNLSGQIKGIEIGDGAMRTLGDDVQPNTENKNANAEKVRQPSDKPSTIESSSTENSTEKAKSSPLTIILKPRSTYTDAARKNQTQGKVVLRVTFLANGGTGSVSIVSGLPDGLTEQAIAAASRILFIPAQKNGLRVSVTKTVEYTFTIY